MNFFGLGQYAEIDIVFDGAENRKYAEYKLEENKKDKYLIYYDGETVSGQVNVTLKRPGSKLEHHGIKIELIGQIELYYDRGNHHEFTSLLKELARPGDLIKNTSYPFEFPNVEKPYEVYVGANVRLRYFLRVSIVRRFGDIVKEIDIAVHTLCSYPEINSPIKMEVGIEDCLHIEFEYNKSKYHLKDVIVGKIYFLLVRIKIKHMEIAIIKRETTGTGPNIFTENETIAKYEIMDGAPVKGESIPIRVFLAGYEISPTMRDINKKFSVKYFLNLVLMDTEDRRYFKQQEITLWRKADKNRKSTGTGSQNPHVPSHLVGSDRETMAHQQNHRSHLRQQSQQQQQQQQQVQPATVAVVAAKNSHESPLHQQKKQQKQDKNNVGVGNDNDEKEAELGDGKQQQLQHQDEQIEVERQSSGTKKTMGLFTEEDTSQNEQSVAPTQRKHSTDDDDDVAESSQLMDNTNKKNVVQQTPAITASSSLFDDMSPSPTTAPINSPPQLTTTTTTTTATIIDPSIATDSLATDAITSTVVSSGDDGSGDVGVRDVGDGSDGTDNTEQQQDTDIIETEVSQLLPLEAPTATVSSSSSSSPVPALRTIEKPIITTINNNKSYNKINNNNNKATVKGSSGGIIINNNSTIKNNKDSKNNDKIHKPMKSQKTCVQLPS